MNLDDNNLPPSDAARVTEPTPVPEPPSPRLETPITPGYLGPIDPLLPEDLRVPWGWGDLVLLVAVAISGTFVVSLLLIKGFTIAGISFRQVQNIPGDRNLFLILNQALLSVVLLPIWPRKCATVFVCLSGARLAGVLCKPDRRRAPPRIWD